MNIITETDRITTHDFKPTHRKRPTELIDARIHADRMWKRYDEILEYEIYGAEYEMRETDHQRIDDALSAASAAEAWYAELYDRWNMGEPQ